MRDGVDVSAQQALVGASVETLRVALADLMRETREAGRGVFPRGGVPDLTAVHASYRVVCAAEEQLDLAFYDLRCALGEDG